MKAIASYMAFKKVAADLPDRGGRIRGTRRRMKASAQIPVRISSKGGDSWVTRNAFNAHDSLFVLGTPGRAKEDIVLSALSPIATCHLNKRFIPLCSNRS